MAGPQCSTTALAGVRVNEGDGLVDTHLLLKQGPVLSAWTPQVDRMEISAIWRLAPLPQAVLQENNVAVRAAAQKNTRHAKTQMHLWAQVHGIQGHSIVLQA